MALNSSSASRPSCCAAVADPLDGLRERLLAGHPDLVLQVDVAGGDEHVEVRPLRDPDGLHGALRVAVLAAGEAGDRDAPGLLWRCG